MLLRRGTRLLLRTLDGFPHTAARAVALSTAGALRAGAADRQMTQQTPSHSEFALKSSCVMLRLKQQWSFLRTNYVCQLFTLKFQILLLFQYADVAGLLDLPGIAAEALGGTEMHNQHRQILRFVKGTTISSLSAFFP